MNVTLKVWRQKNANTPGEFKTYTSPTLNPNMSTTAARASVAPVPW